MNMNQAQFAALIGRAQVMELAILAMFSLVLHSWAPLGGGSIGMVAANSLVIAVGCAVIRNAP